MFGMKKHYISWFLYNTILQTCLLISVYLRQNVLSAVHFVVLVCFPLFQPATPPDEDADRTVNNGRSASPPPTSPPPPVYQTKFIIISSAAVLLTCASKILFVLTPQLAKYELPCDDVGLMLRTLVGYDERPYVLAIDVALAIAFAYCSRRRSPAGPFPWRRYRRRRSRAVSAVSSEVSAAAAPEDTGRRIWTHVPRCACLAALCASGTVVPSYACCVYYATFVAVTMAAILGRLSDAAVRRVFRAVCLYTCVHAFALFAHQTEWVRRNVVDRLADETTAEQFGLVAYYGLKCSPAEATPGLRGSHYFLPVLLIVQHFLLWMYSNTIIENNTAPTTIRSTTDLHHSMSNLFKWENMLLIGIKTVGFKVVILVWSISYPGWMTLAMLLWTTVFWKYLNSRSNLIVIQLLAVCMLFIEYAYLVGGNVMLKQLYGSDLKRPDERGDFPTSLLIKTAFTVTFWIALNQTNRKQLQELDEVVNAKLLSTDLKKCLSYVWVACLISTMLLYGFLGYCKINLIQIGYISMSLLFLTAFQISFIVWKRTITLYWTVVILYSIVVVTVTYVFQFYRLADVLATSFKISYDLQRDIGLDDKTSNLRIIVPAIISIAVLIHFQHLHQHFMSTLHVKKRQPETVDDGHSVDTATKKGSWLSATRDVAMRVLHMHLDKLEITLAVILVMSKPCLFSGTLLVTIFFWTFFEHNVFTAIILFLHIITYIVFTLGYQFTFFDYENWTYEFQLLTTGRQTEVATDGGGTTFRFSISELFGVKIFDKNESLFGFLKYELLMLTVMVLKKSVSLIMAFNYHPPGTPPSIFPNVKYADMNKGIPEFLMYLANEGFSLFGLEVTFVVVAIVIYMSPDVYASLYALWLMRFAVKNRTTAVSNHWHYFVMFVYLATAFKYALLIESTFNPNSAVTWKTVDLTQNTWIVLYDASYGGAWIKPLIPFDFILMVFASRQLKVFRKNDSRKTTVDDDGTKLTNEEEFPDYMTSNLTRRWTYLDILKRIVFGNSMLMILFVIFWISRHKMDLFSLCYLCAGTLIFWKGTYFYRMPRPKILKLWNWLLEYCIMVMFIKIFFHLLGCVVLNYFQWYSCIFIRIFSMFCPPRIHGERTHTCGTSKQDMELLGDVFTFTMLLFQRRFFNSGHFDRLIEDMEAVIKLGEKMCNLVNEWERRKKDESRKIDLESLKKVEIKLNRIRELKEQYVAREHYHSQACLDGEYMFEEIDDDVFLVKKYDVDSFAKFKNTVPDSSPWLYRQYVYIMLYLTEKVNRFSKEYRQIMQILNMEKQILKEEGSLNIVGLYKGSLDLLTPHNNDFYFNKMRYNVDAIKNKHHFMQLLWAVWNAILSSTDLLCYFAIFYNAMDSYCDEISMVPLVMVTVWGLLSVPRPSKTFWIVLITYTQVTGLVKYVCSFKHIPWLYEERKLNYLKTEDFFLYPTLRIGIGDYRNKIQTDLMVLLILFIHRRKLIRLGLWTYNDDNEKTYVDKNPSQSKIERKTPLRMIVLKFEMYLSPIIEFYKNLRAYHTEGTVNVYPAMLILIALQIPLSLLMDGTAKGLIALNRVSMIFLQMFAFHIVTIVLDRWFYARRFILGKLMFHLLYVLVFLTQLQPRTKLYSFLNQLFEYNMYLYIVISSYQIRNGFMYRNASSFIWSRYTIFNLLAYKLYYYCPFVHETRTVLDWMWTDSSLAIMEWFKMDELFTHVCCVKCICNFRNTFDTPRGQKQSQTIKLLIGGGIVTVILTVVIFPIAWFSVFEKAPDTPSSIELTVTFGEDSTVFSTKSDDVYRLDSTDFKVMKELYTNSSVDDQALHMELLQQYEFDEISSINVIPQSINTWPITPYEFDKFKKIIFTNSNIKISVDWALTHHKGMEISRGKNTAIMDGFGHFELTKCLKNKQLAKEPGRCNKLVVDNLLPKFLSLHLKSSEVEVISELTVHNSGKPYMDMGLTFNYDVANFKYWWDMEEICPSGESATYLIKMPYSSCADNDNKVARNNTNIMYNIYIFSDKYSSTLQYLDDKGIVGLYTIVIVYFGYKLAFDIFRTFKFKLGYTETPYPDRILQLCYEIYLVRNFGEYEMEEDLYAMLIFLFRSPETLIRYTRMPLNEELYVN